MDFIKEYWDHVFSFFISEYESGRTPNPDILCNKYIKFDAFLKFAKENNCDMIAMGHYAQVSHENGVTRLLRAVDLNKDQTYFLCLLSEEQLSTTTTSKSTLTKVTILNRHLYKNEPEL